MNTIVQKTSALRFMIAVNADRFLVPLTIVGALFLAGWVMSFVLAQMPADLPRP